MQCTLILLLLLLKFQGTPLLALTGTADDSTMKVITNDLSLKNPEYILVSPERKNIRFSIRKIAKEEMFLQLSWLIKMIKDMNTCCPKTIIFCNTLNDIAAVFNYLMLQLGSYAYHPSDTRKPDCRIIGIYHSNSFQEQKDRLFTQMKSMGKKRVIVASSALSMGVNFPDITYVINWGPARNLLDQLQEGARAGRDGSPAHVVVIFNGQQLAHCNNDVKKFVNTEGCYRVAAYQSFDPAIKPHNVKHNCCNYCSQSCQCNEEGCPVTFPFDTFTPTNLPSSQVVLTRSITDHDKENLKLALIELMSQLNSKQPALFDIASTHGFSSQLICDIIDSGYKIFTVNDILSCFPVFSISHAYQILEIVQELFMDIPESSFEVSADHTDLELYSDLVNFEETLNEYFMHVTSDELNAEYVEID